MAPKDTPAAGAEKTAPAKPMAGLDSAITLKAISCGDSCYLEYSQDGEDKTALCTAEPCKPWVAAGELPKALRGKKAVVRMGKGTQVDSAGNVMSRDFPAIEDLTIL